MIQTEIIAFSTSAVDVRLPNARNRFSFDEYLRSYAMPTVGMLKVVYHTMRMRKL